MNTEDFIKTLSEETSYDEDICTKINEVLEKRLIIGRNNKKRIKKELIEKIQIDEIEADNIYNIVMDILTREIKDKIKHPLN